MMCADQVYVALLVVVVLQRRLQQIIVLERIPAHTGTCINIR